MPVNLVDVSRLDLLVDPEGLRWRPSPVPFRGAAGSRVRKPSTAHLCCSLVRGTISIPCSLGLPSPGSGDVLPRPRDRPG